MFLEKVIGKSLSRNNFNEIFKINKIENKNNEENEINTYIKNGVKLEINNIHGVKGETHLATLYLKTFWYKYDIRDYLIKLLSLELNDKQKSDKQNTQRNRNIFVVFCL